jgi:hypothetical protein
MSLPSKIFAERTAAVAATEQAAQEKCTAAVAALNNQIRAAHDEAAKTKRTAADAAARLHAELDRALAVDVLKDLEPLMRAYPDAPRSTASSIAKAWRAANERARAELGTEIHCAHLAMAFAHVFGVVDKFGAVDSFHFNLSNAAADASDKASREILGGAHDAVVDGAIRELEMAVVAQASANPYPDAEGAKARFAYATAAGMRQVGIDLQAQRSADAKAATAGLPMAPGSRFI